MCLLSVLAAGLHTVFTQLNYPSDEWRHNYLHPQLCAPTGDPAAFAIVTQAIFSLLELDENDVCSSIRPWGLPIIDLGRPPSWADIYFGCRVAPVCPVCWDKKCLLQKQLAQSPGHLSSIANITPPGHRVNTPPPPRPRTAHPAALHYTAGISPKYPHTTRRVVQVLNLNTH